MKKTERIVVRSDEGHFQGELYIGPVVVLPGDVVTMKAKRECGVLIVGHSETGHHHVIEAADTRLLETQGGLVAYLVAENAYVDLVHQRSFDTHPILRLEFKGGGCITPKGIVKARKVVRQREMSPAGWVRAAD